MYIKTLLTNLIKSKLQKSLFQQKEERERFFGAYSVFVLKSHFVLLFHGVIIFILFVEE